MAVTPKYHAQNRIGIPALWVFTRMSQLLWLTITMKAIYDVRGKADFAETFFSLGLFFVVFSIVLHPFSDGCVGPDGIHFRRYFRYKTRPWEEIESIRWLGSRLKTTVRGKGLLSGTVSFWLDPLEAIKQYRIQESGGEPEPPAVLKLIAALPLDAPPKIVQGPLTNSGISMVFIAGFGSMMLIVLVGLLHRMIQGR